MPLQTLFALSFILVAPFWLLIIALPHWSWTRRIIRSPLIVLPAALPYIVLLLPRLIEGFAALGTFSLDSIADLFGQHDFALIVWLHMLAVDLLAGRWAYLDARERGISAWIMSPLLLAILSFAPLGVVLYLGARAINGSARGKAS